MKIIIEQHKKGFSVEASNASLEDIAMITLKAYIQSAHLAETEHSDDCDCTSIKFHREVANTIDKLMDKYVKEIQNKDTKIKEMFNESEKS